MLGIGLDIVDLDRFERAMARSERFGQGVFSDDERAHAASQAHPIQHLAARFCAKEAVVKALMLTVFEPSEIEIGPWPQGRVASLSGSAALRAEEWDADVLVSLTHTKTSAGAVAVAVRRGTLPEIPSDLLDFLDRG